ncbi:hypothetical protein ACFP65_06105 [Marinilactibacillus sp. GCM10026970]|uniref:hypothetical protein n=1 Tax=Marinilactibacillus sp. GCM10026970 TaxID=3252642 RepID=UPI0036212B40
MFLSSFNYDALDATIVNIESRVDSSVKTIERVKLDNGVLFVYTLTDNGHEHLETNYALEK